MNVPKYIWVNGRVVDSKKPHISVFDRGFLYGDGVYETIRVYAGKMFRFRHHYFRLRHSARGLKIKIPFSSYGIEKSINRLLRLNQCPNAIIRLTLTRGTGPRGFDPRPCKNPTLVIMSFPTKGHPLHYYKTGIKAVISHVRRNPPDSLDPSLKSINSLNNIFATMDANRTGAYEAILLNTEGFIAEGSISNIFFIKKGVLKTPSLQCGLLAGVTRDVVIHLAHRQKLKVVEGFFLIKDLFHADEIFITNTSMEVMPVTTIIDEKGKRKVIGDGQVGFWVHQLRVDYQEFVGKELKRFKGAR